MVGIIMIYIFLLILFVAILFNLMFTKDIMHPTVLFKSIWFISLLVYAFFKDYWGFFISNATLSIFMVGFISFDLGYLFFNTFRIKKLRKVKPVVHKYYYRTLKFNRVILLLCLITLVSTILFVSMINTVGITKLFSKEFFITFREMQYDGSGDANTETHLFNILKALAIVIFIYYLTDKGMPLRKKVIYYVSISVFLFTMIFSTGRMWLLALFIQALVISTTISKKKGQYFNLKSQINFLKKGLFVVISFLTFFYIYGKITADKIDSSNVINKIAIYISSPLIAFNERWEEIESSSNYFGEYLLSPVYNILDKLFFTNIIQPRERLPYIFGDNGFATNVYTFYDSQVRDFGVIAIPFVMFLIGFFLSFLKYKSENEVIAGFWTAVYAYFMYALSLSFFNDKFFASSTGTYLTILIYFIAFKTKLINKSVYNLSQIKK